MTGSWFCGWPSSALYIKIRQGQHIPGKLATCTLTSIDGGEGITGGRSDRCNFPAQNSIDLYPYLILDYNSQRRVGIAISVISAEPRQILPPKSIIRISYSFRSIGRTLYGTEAAL